MDELEMLKNDFIIASKEVSRIINKIAPLKAAQETFTFDLWINLYPNNIHAIHSRLESAKNDAGSSIIARHHQILTVRKGEGL